MFPQKRRNSDPEEELPTTSKRAAHEGRLPTIATNPTASGGENASERLQRLSAVISREFQREITLKQEQLELIDERLAQARHLLERLRYGIVAEYYRKQELPLTQADAAAVRGTLLAGPENDKPPPPPQIPLHPSIKKIIGKKPRTYDEILRACPKRAAAQTAQHTIRAKSQVQRRQERRLQQLIREQGIVIDHEKQEAAAASAVQPLIKPELPEVSTPTTTTTRMAAPLVGKALNATRLNNKTKHLVVVGNTSKYIGGDDGPRSTTSAEPVPFHGQKLSHKWLVYVQAKEALLPLESIVKKVRFFLHTSYRPNDVVDICAPPFQIARRGWGEFPVRIQLFFHERLQQKPVQLVHQLVLDKTQSGLHTLGAETLVEVWLRGGSCATAWTTATTKVEAPPEETRPLQKVVDETKANKTHAESTQTTTTNHHTQKHELLHQTIAAPATPKPRLISYTHNKEELDDNLFEFLNNIGGTQTGFCGDIEKIQPTVMVSEAEQLTHMPSPQLAMAAPAKTINNTNSPRKFMSPTKALSNFVASKNVSKVQTMTLATTSAAAATATAAKQLESTNPASSNSFLPKVGVFNVTLPAPPKPTPNVNFSGLRIVSNSSSSNNNSSSSKNMKTIVLHSGGKSITPTTTSVAVASSQSLVAPQTQPAPKKILQKKLVQLIDADGKIKYLQMLVATNAAPAPAPPPLFAKATSNTSSSSSSNVPSVPATMMKTLNLAANTSATTTTSGAPAVTISKLSAASVTLLSNATPKTLKPMPVKSVPLNPIAVAAHSKATPPPRNVVFQKEGKLYIIDPQQMKLRQEQKKQFSLLKPQVSLLKQQQRPPEQSPKSPAAAANTTIAPPTSSSNNVACDHDYAPTPTPLLQLPPTTKPQLVTPPTPPSPASIFRKPLPATPQVHLGMRQTRVAASNAHEQLQQQRNTFAQQFGDASFGEMRAAVEYLLRRLPLVLPTATCFEWCYKPQEFAALPALKQRACEWLRAKYISNSLRKHKNFQGGSYSAYWSTREIVAFARCHAFTPALKPLQSSSADKQAQPPSQLVTAAPFTALVKSELKQQPQLPLFACETLTVQSRLAAWTHDMWQRLQQHEVAASAAQIIDVVSTTETEAALRKTSAGAKSTSTTTPLHCGRNTLYLPPPAALTDASELVGDVCRAHGVQLATAETVLAANGSRRNGDDDTDVAEAGVEVVQPLAQTLLAQCLRLFVEKLLRQSLAAKLQHSADSPSAAPPISGGGGDGDAAQLLIGVQDVARVLTQCDDFDFLTNCHFGVVAKTTEETPKPV